MAAFAVLMPVMLFVTWGLQLDENLPEPWNSVLMLLNPSNTPKKVKLTRLGLHMVELK